MTELPRIPARHIRIKRAYEPPHADDGVRILIDRLWPRGIKKEALALDRWAKELAPSTALRKWFGHDPLRWDGFRSRYFAELAANPEGLARLRPYLERGPVTLLYAAVDEEHNNAVALRQFLMHGSG